MWLSCRIRRFRRLYSLRTFLSMWRSLTNVSWRTRFANAGICVVHRSTSLSDRNKPSWGWYIKLKPTALPVESSECRRSPARLLAFILSGNLPPGKSSGTIRKIDRTFPSHRVVRFGLIVRSIPLQRPHVSSPSSRHLLRLLWKASGFSKNVSAFMEKEFRLFVKTSRRFWSFVSARLLLLLFWLSWAGLKQKWNCSAFHWLRRTLHLCCLPILCVPDRCREWVMHAMQFCRRNLE